MEKTRWLQPPYCTTLMGCFQGVFDYYGLKYSPAMLFGLTGHAFIINIHKEICPSGPYVWDHRFFYDLAEQLGIKLAESPVMTPETPEALRSEEVDRLITSLEGNNPCLATYLEHQLIKDVRGDEIRLILPWREETESQIGYINAGDLSPCLEQAGFIQFGYFEKVSVPPGETTGKKVRRALLAAMDLYNNPEKYQKEGYQSGFGAYEYWISALQKEKFEARGHWWNSRVWSECRDMASRFFEELTQKESNLDGDTLKSLTSVYRIVSDRIAEAGGEDLDREKKIILLTEALEMEYEAQYLIGRLLNP